MTSSGLVVFTQLPQLHEEVPFLRHLHVDDIIYTGLPFRLAPRLTTLSFRHAYSNPLQISAIPWHQLTELEISPGASVLIALDIIKDCPQLEGLTIYEVLGSPKL